MEETVDDSLEVKEIRIATEPIDPRDPHKQRVLHWVEKSKDYHHVALDIAEGESVIQRKG